MRKQIAAANWKMNLTMQQGEALLNDIMQADFQLKNNHAALFAVPYPYLHTAKSIVEKNEHFAISAQNCYHKSAGAYTGEVSVEMLKSIDIQYCVIGHSERREYFNETNAQLAEKLNLLLEQDITPVFCCGEPLSIREAGTQNDYVATQLKESIFHLSPEQAAKIIIAYEPIWAIGTGKTATTEQAQEIHAFLRSVLATQFGEVVANTIPILYGGSVKAGNAQELFAQPDVDGGLVGGASLIAADFIAIIKALN